MASLQAKLDPITFEEAKHITNRLLFKARRSYIDSLVGANVSNVIDNLIDNATTGVPEPIDPATNSTWVWTGATDGNSGTGYLRKVLRTIFRAGMRDDLIKLSGFYSRKLISKNTWLNAVIIREYLR